MTKKPQIVKIINNDNRYLIVEIDGMRIPNQTDLIIRNSTEYVTEITVTFFVENKNLILEHYTNDKEAK